jgi:Uri superfamily endonuclease
MQGTYCLCISLSEISNIKVGSLGLLEFKAGKYVYIGSALKSMKPRIIRHLKTSQGLNDVRYWHIDYFLSSSVAVIDKIFIIENPNHLECLISKKVSNFGTPIPKFGSSDCKCNSHLFKVKNFKFLEKIGLTKLDLDSF